MKDFYADLARLAAEGHPFVIATVIDTGGSTPRLAGSQTAVWADGFTGTIGGGAFEKHVHERARTLLADPKRHVDRFDIHLVRDLAMCCGGKMSVFLHRVEPGPTFWIFGAGHVGTALARMAALAGFAVTVVDARAEWADPARFPEDVRVIDAEPEDHLRAAPPGPADFVVVVTHDHALDEGLIRALAPHPLRYLGLIGSRGKWGRFRKRLDARGVPSEAVERVHCPVGLDIGAVTPEEIAVSVVGEMIAVRRRGA